MLGGRLGVRLRVGIFVDPGEDLVKLLPLFLFAAGEKVVGHQRVVGVIVAFFHQLKHAGHRDLQCGCNLFQTFDGQVFLAALHLTDVGGVQSGHFGQPFLAETLRLTITPQPLAHSLCEQQPAYAFRLMLGGGEICGFCIPGARAGAIQEALEALVTKEQMQARYGKEGLAPLLFAVGDGNHSLATAKACYEEIKQRLGDAALDHPARYALCEVVNVHDESLHFEPIYRVVFGAEPKALKAEFKAYCAALSGNAPAQRVLCVHGKTEETVEIPAPDKQLTVGTVQAFLDAYVVQHPEVRVDYIHGENALRTLSEPEGAIGFLFDGMHKSELFKTVIFDGALPRKTFSMGHAKDKRYYLEARKIIK